MSLETYHCPNCEKQFLLHSAAKAANCCYCHHPLQIAADGERPKISSFIPFGITEDEAREALVHWQKGRLLTPYGFRGPKGLAANLCGLYLPVWLFAVPFTLDFTAKATIENTTISNAINYVETNRYTINRRGEITFPHVPVPAFSAPITPWFDAVGGYDYTALTAFTDDCLQNHQALGITEAEALPDALFEALKQQAKARLERSIKGYNRIYDSHLTLTPHDLSAQLTLLPVWLSVFWYGKSPYGFILNGQTGNHYGLLPLSKLRLALLCTGAFAAMSSLCFFGGVQL